MIVRVGRAAVQSRRRQHLLLDGWRQDVAAHSRRLRPTRARWAASRFPPTAISGCGRRSAAPFTSHAISAGAGPSPPASREHARDCRPASIRASSTASRCSMGKLFVSTNGAATFTEQPLTLPDGLPTRGGRGDDRGGQDRIYATPGKEGDLWLAAFNGLYHSTDSGVTFTVWVTSSQIHAFGFGKAAPGATVLRPVPDRGGGWPARHFPLYQRRQELGADQRRSASMGFAPADHRRPQAVRQSYVGSHTYGDPVAAARAHCIR
jgi:hypothetical protein